MDIEFTRGRSKRLRGEDRSFRKAYAKYDGDLVKIGEEYGWNLRETEMIQIRVQREDERGRNMATRKIDNLNF